MGLRFTRLSLAIQIRPSFEPEESYLLSYSADKDTGKVGCYFVQGPGAGKSSWDPPKGGVLIDDAEAKEILAFAENLKISVVPDSQLF